jgi:hypothetical protein
MHPDCFLISLLHRLDFLYDFVEKLTFGSSDFCVFFESFCGIFVCGSIRRF